MHYLRLAFGALALCVCATNASANITIYNATQSKMKVDATLPNGEVKSVTLDEAVDSLDSDSFMFAAGVNTVKVSIAEEGGAAVWSGTLSSNDTGIVIPAGKGAKFVPSGTDSGEFSVPKSASFINLTGDAITLDLVGHNGLGAHRGIVMSTTGFVPKLVVKLDPRESTFGLRVTVKGKAATDIEGTVDPQRYWVLWKRSRDGEYRINNLGYLPAPPKKK